jgi:hypothetical protein
MLARNLAEFQLVVTKFKDSDDSPWHMTKWVPFNLTKFHQKPAWLVVLYGKRRDDSTLDEAVASPLDVEADQREGDRANLTLPVVLEVLTSGSNEEKMRVLLQLHKMMYHKSADQMRIILRRSGVPIRTLSLVGDAVKSCPICAKWEKPGTKPSMKTHLSLNFNESVFGDLLFLTKGAFISF